MEFLVVLSICNTSGAWDMKLDGEREGNLGLDA